MNTQINVAQLSAYFIAWQNCKKSNNTLWIPKWEEAIEELLQHLPHGSGLDAGVHFDWDNSTSESLRFTCSYHHMDEYGGYDGWTDHEVIIQSSLSLGFKLQVNQLIGEDKDDTLGYLTDLFSDTFCYQPNYRSKNNAVPQQLTGMYKRLKNIFDRLVLPLMPLKKLWAKS